MSRKARRGGRGDEEPRSAPPVPRPAVLVRVVVVLLVLAATFHVVLTRKWTWDHVTRHYNGGLASLCATLLRPFVDGVRADGIDITSPGFTVRLIEGCDGLDAMAILVAGVLAFPATWRQRGKGLLVGIPVIFAANLFRILVLFPLGLHAPRLFEVVHVHVFQVFIVAVAAGSFLWWAWSVTRHVVAAPAPGSTAGG